MKPIVWILGGIGAYLLFSKKEQPAPSSVITIPEVVVKPTVKKTQPKSTEKSPLTKEENDLLNAGNHDTLYNAALKSSNYTFVYQAANQLAEEGDTRAIDLTQRIADWKHA